MTDDADFKQMEEGERAEAEKQRRNAMLLQQKRLNAAKRVRRILRARESLLDYTVLSMPDPKDPDDPTKSRYNPQAVHKLLCKKLEAVERGEITRLIVNVHPRIGKSELVSKRFPTWFVGRDPYRQVITSGYSDDFVSEFGREAREIMRSPFYRQVFPDTALMKGAQSVERLQTTQGGVMTFAGVGGSITGKGADLLILDDPVKGRAAVSSRRLRDRDWSWFTQDAMSRLMGAMGRVVICMTRWHEDDIVGRLLDPNNPYFNPVEAAKWDVVNLPAWPETEDEAKRDPLKREVGEVMWSERITKEFLEGQRRLDPAGFEALYMGRPAPPDGDFFKADHLRVYNDPSELPDNLRFYAASDHAVSLAQGRDKTCMGVVGVDEDDNIWVLPDVVWRQMDAEAQVDSMLGLMREHRPLLWWAEKGHISQSLGPFLRKRMQEEQTYSAIVEKTPVRDKQSRAQAIQGRMSMGKVFFPAFAGWWNDAKEQMLNFPYGTHDDFVDFVAWIGIGLSQLSPANRKLPKTREIQTGSIPWILQSSQRIMARQQGADSNRYLN